MPATATKTQGTQFHKVASATTSVEITDIIDVTPPSPDSDEIEITNLSSTAKEFLQGLRDYGEGSFELNWSPTNASHIALQADFDSGTLREWLIGFSDGTTAAPTVAASAFAVPATTRSWVKFTGFVKGLKVKGGTNDVFKATLTVRASGTPTYYAKV